MNKAKTTMDIAKECGADFEHANSEIVTSYASDVLIFSPNSIEAFRKACIADYKSRCKLVGYTADYDISCIEDKSDSTGMYRAEEENEYTVKLFTMPNDGE